MIIAAAAHTVPVLMMRRSSSGWDATSSARYAPGSLIMPRILPGSGVRERGHDLPGDESPGAVGADRGCLRAVLAKNTPRVLPRGALGDDHAALLLPQPQGEVPAARAEAASTR